ncbi:hypothetical protein C8Q70DRAFT_937657 [Cubamyces menziesii]|nr:hypothetical protein C8Q70DRAFT_937657 [Cubamyces menziesii]
MAQSELKPTMERVTYCRIYVPGIDKDIPTIQCPLNRFVAKHHPNSVEMPSVNDLFHKDVAHSLFDEFDEESSSLPSLPPTINVVDRDVLRARRRSDKKAAKILDITIAREDNDADVDMASPTYPEWSGIDGLQPPVQGARRTSLSQLNMGSLTLLDSPMDEDEGAPLIEKSSPTKGARAGGESGKTRKKLAFIFRKLGRRKAPKAKNPNPAPRATLGPLVPTSENDENPFGDEHRMQWADEEDNGSPSGAVVGACTEDTPARTIHVRADNAAVVKEQEGHTELAVLSQDAALRPVLAVGVFPGEHQREQRAQCHQHASAEERAPAHTPPQVADEVAPDPGERGERGRRSGDEREGD